MIYENAKTVTTGMSNAKFRKDLTDSVELLSYIEKQIIYDARITKLGTEAGEFEVSLYEDGLAQPEGRKEVKVYSVYSFDNYFIDQEIQVRMLPDGTGLIVRTSLPPGTGIYKVLQLLTATNPGSPGYDYWRFP